MDTGHDAASATLPLAYALPFVGLLASIALFPLLAPHVWERRFGLVTAFWSAAFLLPFGAIEGGRVIETIVEVAAHDYLPFVILLMALFVVAGGIRIAGTMVGTPLANLALLGIGTLGASLLGTTGASMLLIRPLIEANRHRRRKTHVFVFFIFLVGNIGGALTPLGDPPLFLGFLRGIEFGWTLRALAAPTAIAAGALLALFFLLDLYHWRHEAPLPPTSTPRRITIEGAHNFLALGLIVGAVLLSGTWRSGLDVPIGFGLTVRLENLVRDMALVVVALVSWRTTPTRIRVENAFAWTPIQEVAVLFAGIFVTLVPILGALKAGGAGPFGPLLHLVGTPDGRPIDWAYFWLAGGLSSVLDNAPTYLVFFDLASGDPAQLMGPLSRTLLAISAGAVFMGAGTYLGNAPNFMIKSICEERGVRMPGFFGYLLWSVPILLPLFGLITWLFLL